uniref:Nucleotide exchange factor SIL1 n=1 Tax=Glossina brevipalpis TaxID=37001 RepID=A0A1A9X4G1_9MUSC
MNVEKKPLLKVKSKGKIATLRSLVSLELQQKILLAGEILTEEIVKNSKRIATKTSKVIKGEQETKLPRLREGLNLRKEYKLIMDEEKKQMNAVNQANEISKNSNALMIIYKYMGNGKKLKTLKKPNIEDKSKEKQKIINYNLNRYKELKKNFDERKNYKTDGEILVQLMRVFDNQSLKIKYKILNEFNYLLSQYDNALTFVNKEGLQRILLPIIVHQTTSSLRLQALRILGAMTQNNPKVQRKVYEKNFGRHLNQILLSSNDKNELSSALYAFGSLLRKNPKAQNQILSHTGSKALISLLNKNYGLKIKTKVITLITDIIVEVVSNRDDPLYAKLNFLEQLEHLDYCHILERQIILSFTELLTACDSLEYFVNAFDSAQFFCTDIWRKSKHFYVTLTSLQLSSAQSAKEYCNEVAELLNDLIKKIFFVLLLDIRAAALKCFWPRTMPLKLKEIIFGGGFQWVLLPLSLIRERKSLSNAQYMATQRTNKTAAENY